MCIDSHSITTHTRLVNPNSGQWLLPGRERQEQEHGNRERDKGIQYLRCFVLKLNNSVYRLQRPLAKSVNLIALGGRYWNVHYFISHIV